MQKVADWLHDRQKRGYEIGGFFCTFLNKGKEKWKWFLMLDWGKHRMVDLQGSLLKPHLIFRKLDNKHSLSFGDFLNIISKWSHSPDILFIA